MELIPYEIGDDKLRLLHGERREWFLESLKQISEPLAMANGVGEAWNGFLCRYGIEGFKEEIDTLMRRLDSEPEKGAAMFRNRITTMQHHQHWIDAMNRIADGTIDQAPEWALSILDDFMSRRR